MSEPFLAEIRLFGFNFAPRGWAFCDGQILPINQNQSLFSLLGTTYGGDGRTSFALPGLRGRAPMHVGTGHSLGQKTGEDKHMLSEAQIPQHTHTAKASSAAGSTPIPLPADTNVLASSAPGEMYHGPSSPVTMRTGTVANAGGGQGHENMQPFLALSFCIALQGVFPSRN